MSRLYILANTKLASHKRMGGNSASYIWHLQYTATRFYTVNIYSAIVGLNYYHITCYIGYCIAIVPDRSVLR